MKRITNDEMRREIKAKDKNSLSMTDYEFNQYDRILASRVFLRRNKDEDKEIKKLRKAEEQKKACPDKNTLWEHPLVKDLGNGVRWIPLSDIYEEGNWPVDNLTEEQCKIIVEALKNSPKYVTPPYIKEMIDEMERFENETRNE